MLKCPQCNGDIIPSFKNCPHCFKKLKKNFYQQWWFWVIIGIFMIFGLIQAIIENSNNNYDISHTPIEIEINSNNNDIIDDDFKHSVIQVLKHHEKYPNGQNRDAEGKGQWAGFNANLWILSSNKTSLKYRLCYHALKGEKSYLDEFRYNQYYIDDVEEIIKELSNNL